MLEEKQMTDIRVRVGTPEDVHQFMDLCLQGSEENGFVQPDAQKLLAEVWPALNRDGGICGVIGTPGADHFEGGILLRTCKLWYSDQIVLEERGVFVHPEYRSAKGGRARKLCEFAKAAAAKLEMPLMIGILSNSRTEGKVRLYERIFGKPAGAYWLIGAETGVTNKAEH
jgi:GNAT superfamily N-acetyltransferase